MSALEPKQMVGRVLESRYFVEQHLGTGSMGSVFRARHVRLPRWFAVKLLHPRLVENPKLLRRFQREAELAGRLAHQNVVGVVDYGEVDGVSYLVMELAPGVPLYALLPSAFERSRVVNIIGQLLDGLDHAHARGLVHRDLKPENIIVERGPETEIARIVDFGIAVLREAIETRTDRLTTSGLVLGTPHYMAPEVATDQAFDHRADLFALGVICYELLTGRFPFDGDGVSVVHANVNNATPPMRERAPDVLVDTALEDFTRCLMAKNPDDRPSSAAAARHLLAQAERAGLRERGRTSARRRVAMPALDVVAIGSAKTLALSPLDHPRSDDPD